MSWSRRLLVGSINKYDVTFHQTPFLLGRFQRSPTVGWFGLENSTLEVGVVSPTILNMVVTSFWMMSFSTTKTMLVRKPSCKRRCPRTSRVYSDRCWIVFTRARFHQFCFAFACQAGIFLPNKTEVAGKTTSCLLSMLSLGSEIKVSYMTMTLYKDLYIILCGYTLQL